MGTVYNKSIEATKVQRKKGTLRILDAEMSQQFRQMAKQTKLREKNHTIFNSLE